MKKFKHAITGTLAIVGLFAWVGVLTLLYVMYLFAYDPTRLVILFW